MARSGMMLDIHDYETKFAYAERQIRASALSERNKDLIIRYRDSCLLKATCGRVRLIRVMGVLLLFGRTLGKDFDQLTKEDIEHLITNLIGRQPAYTAETLGTYKTILKNFMIGTYKTILKNFMTWVLVPNEFPTKTPPPLVSWITGHVRKRDKKKLERKDLLTPADIDALLKTCHNPRDKALINILWETGCRVAEIGNLQIKHVTKNDHGYTLDVNGKTGQRSPIIISSAPYLTVWLTNHPFRDNPDSPLWVHYQYAKTPKLLRYDSIRYLLARHFQRAGIKKPFHPHIFRHSRATYVLANAIMNESQAKAYFGWAPDSDMLATYSHLIDADANNAILKENNLAPIKQRELELRPVECRICGELNTPRTEYCTKCGAVLDLAKAYEHQRMHQLKDEVFLKLFRVLVQNGLVDQATKEIHDAGLGPTLQRLARHQDGTAPLGAITAQPEPGPASRSGPTVQLQPRNQLDETSLRPPPQETAR